LKTSGDCYRLKEAFTVYRRLVESYIPRGYWRLLEATGGYMRPLKACFKASQDNGRIFLLL
jgi:hypothetical protein